MRKSILIGVSIVTILGILLAAVVLGFTDTKTRFNAFSSAEADKNTSNTIAIIEPNNETQKSISFRVIELSEKGALQQAQSKVSFSIIEPLYIPAGYNFESVEGKKFTGVVTDLDMASFSYKNGDELLTIKETIVVKTENTTKSSTLPKDTREIVDLNGIEGRFSEENGIKLLGWKIGNLSLSIMSWKNEGQNQTSSSLNKEEMINIAKYVREKTSEEAITEAQTKVSFKILQPTYIPEGYRMNTAQTSGTKFRGVSSELEQASIFYIKGDEFFMRNEYLNLRELLVLKDDTDTNISAPKIPWKFVDINGIQGRFLETSDGVKQLSWEIGNLNLTIGSHAYKENYSVNESGFTGTPLSMEEMVKMARSVR
ncbi:MAG: DUF4367 domain-containing protein [Candidatus Methanoperedens sp.]|nr:DUF4367 domain-containing protein [Candidatus Methanoperedens sp.]